MYRAFALALLETVLTVLTGSSPAIAQTKRASSEADTRSFLDKLVTGRMAADYVLGAL